MPTLLRGDCWIRSAGESGAAVRLSAPGYTLTSVVPALGQQPGTVTHTEYRNLVQVKRAYKLRAYPTRPQEGRAVRLLRDHCDLYNAALQERRGAGREAQREGSP